MAKKNLGEAAATDSMLHANSLVIEVGGSIRRITLEKFIDALNEGQTEMLHEIAWGIPIKDELQTSPAWGMVGNLSAYAAYKGQTGRYLMDASGRAAKLHANNSAIFADGTVLDETKGSVVVIAPRLYFLYLVDAESNIPYLWMSQQPISKHYLANAGNGQYIVVGAYKGSVASGNKLVSRRGVNFDTAGRAISTYWNYAQNFGKDWGLPNCNVWKWIAMMCLCETGGNANIQAKIGMGVGGSAIDWAVTNASAVLKLCGQTAGLGDATGAVAISDSDAKADSCHVSVLGVEDFWNAQWEFIQGVFFGSANNSGQSGTEIFLYEGNRMPSSTEVATHPEGQYRELTRLTTNGYVGVMLKGKHFDIFPSALNGGSTTKWCDYAYNNNTGQVLLVGGYSNSGASAGPFYANSDYAWSYAYSGIGARPAYYGQVQLVDGKDL